jgi:hypothetical protein
VPNERKAIVSAVLINMTGGARRDAANKALHAPPVMFLRDHFALLLPGTCNIRAAFQVSEASPTFTTGAGVAQEQPQHENRSRYHADSDRTRNAARRAHSHCSSAMSRRATRGFLRRAR